MFAAEDSGHYSPQRETHRLENCFQRAPFRERASGSRDRSCANAIAKPAVHVDNRAPQGGRDRRADDA